MTISGYTSPISDRRVEVQGGTLEIPLMPLPGDQASYDVHAEWSSFGTDALQQQTTAAGGLLFRLPQLSRGKITAITAVVQGGAGHSSWPPDFLPTVLLKDSAGNTIASTGGGDTSANAAAYEVQHTIVLTITGNAVFSAATAFFVTFLSENGTNAQDDLLLKRLYATIVPELES
jgi:hypothetical protein